MRTTYLRRGLVALLAAAISSAALAVDDAHTLHIGYQKYGTLVLLKAKGSLEQRLAAQGVTVKWTEFSGGPQLREGLNVGSIDFGVTGEAILVPKDSPITSVAELKGKKVALNKGSNVHYLLVRALEDVGLSITDITPVYLPPADARAAFERGSVDAWVIWDPFQAAAEQQLEARTLRDGAGLVDNHQFYLARGDYAKQHPQVVGTLIEEIRSVGAEAKADVQQATAQIAPLIGLSAEITALALSRQQYDTPVHHTRGGGGPAEDRRHLRRPEADPQAPDHQGRGLDAAGQDRPALTLPASGLTPLTLSTPESWRAAAKTGRARSQGKKR